MVKFTWKMRYVLKQKKNQVSDFLRYRYFCTKICKFSMKFHNSKNKNRKIVFFIPFSTLSIFHENGIKTEWGEGGSAYPYMAQGKLFLSLNIKIMYNGTSEWNKKITRYYNMGQNSSVLSEFRKRLQPSNKYLLKNLTIVIR